MNLQPIERRSGLTPQEFEEEYIKKRKPVIFTDLAKDWPATEKWTFDYFRDNYGDIEVPLYDNEFRKGGKDYLTPRKKMKFGDYLTLIENEPTELRMFLFNIFKPVPELANDIKTPTITDGWMMSLPFMFFGGQGSKVDLHYDLDCASVYLTQFQRRKRVVLFAPEQSPYLYQHPFTVQSSVSVDNPNFDKHPALKRANGYEDVIVHGETLYMPSQFWHYMYYEEGGFSLSLRTHSTYTRLRGAFRVMRHFAVDKGMNMILGEKWSDIKENLAQRNAAAALAV